MSPSSSEITRSTCGSSASATAGGQPGGALIAWDDGKKEIVRAADCAIAGVAVGICPPSAVERAAISNGSCGGKVRVAFGMTVLLNRSLLGFSSGDNAGFAGAAALSFTAALSLPLL